MAIDVSKIKVGDKVVCEFTVAEAGPSKNILSPMGNMFAKELIYKGAAVVFPPDCIVEHKPAPLKLTDGCRVRPPGVVSSDWTYRAYQCPGLGGWVIRGFSPSGLVNFLRHDVYHPDQLEVLPE